MNKQEVLENIEIARQYLDSFHMIIPDDKILFDCYSLPPHTWKAFYAQIYETNGIYRANCAYTYYVDCIGIESYSVDFSSIEKEKHTAKKTDVICKSIFPDSDIANNLIKFANEFTSIERCDRESVVIDGITAGIRLFKNGCMTRDICIINPDDRLPLLEEILLFSGNI